jgi:thioredoxin 1
MKVLRFTAPWCAPCKSLGNTLSTIETNVPIVVIDIDEDPSMAAKYNIRSVPTMIMLDEEENVVKKLTGNQTKDTLKQWLT